MSVLPVPLKKYLYIFIGEIKSLRDNPNELGNFIISNPVVMWSCKFSPTPKSAITGICTQTIKK